MILLQGGFFLYISDYHGNLQIPSNLYFQTVCLICCCKFVAWGVPSTSW